MCNKEASQNDHTSTRKHGRGQVGSELPSTNVDGGRDSQRNSSTRGGGGAVTAAVGSGRGSRDGSDGTRTRRSGLVDQGRTGTLGLGGILDMSGAVKVTSSGLLVLLLVILVHDEGQLLLGLAHTVRAVGTGCRVGSNSIAHALGAAHHAKQFAHFLVLDRVLGNARQRIFHTGAQFRVGGGRKLLAGLPVLVDRRAGTSRVGGFIVGAVGASGVHLGHLRGKVFEVVHLADLVAIDRHQTVVVDFLEVHVDDTTTPDIIHLGTEENGNIGELARTGVDTAIFREEGGNGVVLEFLGPFAVSGLLEGGVTAPLIDVVTIHVDRGLSVTAGQVVGQIGTDGSVVVGGVSDGQRLTVALFLDVRFHITNGGLDVGNRVGVVLVIGNFISGEETNDVGVFGKSVNDLGIASEQGGVPLGIVADDRFGWRGKIANQVDTGIIQGLHALVVVLGRVEGVGPDDIGAQLGQVGNITLAAVRIRERVDVVFLVGTGGAVGRVVLWKCVSTNWSGANGMGT